MDEKNTLYHSDTKEPMFTHRNSRVKTLGYVEDDGNAGTTTWKSGETSGLTGTTLTWHPFQLDNHPHLAGHEYHTVHSSYVDPHHYAMHLYQKAARSGFQLSQEEMQPTIKKHEGRWHDHLEAHQKEGESRGEMLTNPDTGANTTGHITPHYMHHSTKVGNDGDYYGDDVKELNTLTHHDGFTHHEWNE